MAEVRVGFVSDILGAPDRNYDLTTARVLPATGPQEVTQPLVIPWYLRGSMGNLAPGVRVVFAVFEDQSGYIMGRADGEWPGMVPGDVTVSGIVRAQDMATSPVSSFNSHIHGGVETGGGSTSGPS